MWYVLQTVTGKEEELVQMIKELVSPNLYTDCFVGYYERVWRRQQQSIIHVERLFPGYVFIISEYPAELYLELKHVPRMSRLITGDDFEFLPMEKEEEGFFEELLAGNRIVKLSYVETNGKERVYRATGPLKNYMGQVVKYQFKKRYALVRIRLLGNEKIIALGIILREDVQQEIAYGKVEIPLTMPEFYRLEMADPEESLSVGDHVKVISGTLEDMTGVVWKIKKTTVEIGIHLFGQDMSMEVPMEDVCRV